MGLFAAAIAAFAVAQGKAISSWLAFDFGTSGAAKKAKPWVPGSNGSFGSYGGF